MKTTTRKNAKTWTLPRDYMQDVTASGQCPADAGQIVDVSYMLWVDGCGGGLVIRVTHDRSDGEITMDAAESRGEFEPQNGIIGTVGKFRPLVIR